MISRYVRSLYANARAYGWDVVETLRDFGIPNPEEVAKQLDAEYQL